MKNTIKMIPRFHVVESCIEIGKIRTSMALQEPFARVSQNSFPEVTWTTPTTTHCKKHKNIVNQTRIMLQILWNPENLYTDN